jgi:predicted outer membrane repeat protein
LEVQYRIVKDDITAPVAIKVYQVTPTDEQEIAAPTLTDPTDESSSPYSLSFDLDETIDDPTGEYKIVAKLFVDGVVVSERELAGGIFKDEGGNWHIRGGHARDQVTVGTSTISMSGYLVNDLAVTATSPGTASDFYIRTFAGYDSITLTTSKILTAWVDGGDQNDTVTSSGTVNQDIALTIKDSSGLDTLTFSGVPSTQYQTLNLQSADPQVVVDNGDFELTVTLLDAPIEKATGISATKVIGPGYNGQSIFVDTLDDLPVGVGVPDNVSLRKAMAIADTISGANTIEFAESLFAGGPLVITLQDIGGATSSPDQLTTLSSAVVTVLGPGVGLLSISGGGLTRILQGGSSANITIKDLTFADGRVTGTNNGGAIYNNGTMTLERVAFVGNASENNGGAIYSHTARKLTVSDSSFTNNTAYISTATTARGGAIYTSSNVRMRSSSSGAPLSATKARLAGRSMSPAPAVPARRRLSTARFRPTRQPPATAAGFSMRPGRRR